MAETGQTEQDGRVSQGERGSDFRVDLLYTFHGKKGEANVSEMSCVLIHRYFSVHDLTLGPVPGLNAIKTLAPLLDKALPDCPSVLAAENLLLFLHFRNMTMGRNLSGVEYPKYTVAKEV